MNQIFGVLWGITLLYLYPRVVWLQKYEGYDARRDRLLEAGLTWFKLESTLFFWVRQNNGLFFSLSSNWQPWFKVWLCCFLPWVHKISHWSFIFCAGSQCRCYGWARGAVATVGPGAQSPSNDRLCPPFRFTQNAFSEHHVTTKQQAIMEKGNNFQTWFSVEVFSIGCKIAGHQLLHINVTQ